MFEFAFLTGVFSYLIFLLGLSGFLHKNLISGITFLYFISLSFLLFINRVNLRKRFKIKKFDGVSYVFLGLIVFQALVNLIGVFGPEISFDALWYHLTLPKIYILEHTISFIPGGLLYYSAIPKLTEMLYVAGITLGGETLAKLIHYLFGIMSVILVYKISREFLSEKFSLAASLIFYSNLVIGWESISAYVDLTRTFYELLAVLAIILWRKNNSNKWLVLSSVALGLAITVKLLSVFSLLAFVLFICMEAYGSSKPVFPVFKKIFLFVFIAFLIPLPWLLFSFLSTGNPFYPIGVYQLSPKVPFWDILRSLEDPVSPLYLVFLPLILINVKNLWKKMDFLLIYAVSGVILWYLVSRVGGARYMLPYFAGFAIIISYCINQIENKVFLKFSVLLIIFVSLISISYRGLANVKYLPFELGRETKGEFLSKHLNFNFGDFYDLDGYFAKNIKKTDTVLLYGFHNLYYVDFPFIDSSFVKKGDKFDYIAVQNAILPERFSTWRLIYYNNTSKVKLYSNGGVRWEY